MPVSAVWGKTHGFPTGRPALGTAWISREHAARRHAQDCSIAAAVREFSHLRAAILSICYSEHVEVAALSVSASWRSWGTTCARRFHRSSSPPRFS